jgi:hypothetical protein
MCGWFFRWGYALPSVDPAGAVGAMPSYAQFEVHPQRRVCGSRLLARRRIVSNVGSTDVGAPPEVTTALDALDAAATAIGELNFDKYDPAVRLRALERLETVRRRQTVAGHDIIAGLASLPTFHARAADWTRVAYMPDTAWPVSGHLPSSSRAYLRHPVLMPSTWVTTRQQRSPHGDCAPSFQSPPDASRAPFPHRSPRRSSANAACGGLKPPTAGRLRRANLHLLHNTISEVLTYKQNSLPCSWQT